MALIGRFNPCAVFPSVISVRRSIKQERITNLIYVIYKAEGVNEGIEYVSYS